MPNQYSKEQEERYKSHLRVHLKNDELELSADEQIPILEKKNRNRWWLLLLNVLAVAFFGYSFFNDITQLNNTLLYILIAVFIINLFLIMYQKKQYRELIEYLKWKQKREF